MNRYNVGEVLAGAYKGLCDVTVQGPPTCQHCIRAAAKAAGAEESGQATGPAVTIGAVPDDTGCPHADPQIVVNLAGAMRVEWCRRCGAIRVGGVRWENRDPRARLGDAGQVYVTLAAAERYAKFAQRQPEEARRELTVLLLDARLTQGSPPLGGAEASKWRARSRETGLDISATVTREGPLLVVLSCNVRETR